MNVLVVCSKFLPEYSGAGLRAHRTYQRLSARSGLRYEVLCSSLLHFDYINRSYQYEGIRVTRVSSPWKLRYLQAKQRGWRWPARLLYGVFALDESLRTLWFLLWRIRRVDRVHTFGHCWSAGIAAIVAGVFRKPVIRELVTMGSRPDDPPGIRPLVRWALKRSGQIVAISPLLEERARALHFDRVWCRPNPVDLVRFELSAAGKEKYRAQYTRFKSTDRVLLDISKYTPLKNKRLLVEAMRLLPEEVKLVICGPLEETQREVYQELQTLAEQLGVRDRVELQTGFVNHPERYIQMCDVFVFPSLSDGLGTPVLEALCCGKPVVANRLEGVTDRWITDGVSGVLCQPNAQAFAQGILRALQIDAGQMRTAARELREQVCTQVIDAHYLQNLGVEAEPVKEKKSCAV